MNDLIKKDLLHIWHPCSQMKDYEELKPIVIEKAKGIYLYDVEGKSYADVVSSWWCNLLGHCNDRINSAVKSQIDKLEHVIFANFSNIPTINLSARLAAYVPKGLNKFFFTDNGSSAIEAGMKMSFQYHYQTGNPKKRKFMALTDAYHGETIGALSASGVDLYSKIYNPMLMDIVRVEAPDCYRCKWGNCRNECNVECFENVEKEFKKWGEEISAFIVEPIVQAAAGMRIYPSLYLKKLRDICTQYNVHLIADEIATGFGRTGKMFACEHAGISPDIMCISKGLTGGYMPMAIAITTDEIYNAFYADYNEGKAFMHSHTYCGNPLAASAALEVLNILEDDDIINKSLENSIYFNKIINEYLSDLNYVGEIRSIGLINAIELVKDKENKTGFDSNLRIGYEIYKEALKRGVLLRPLGNVMYFNPPLTITKDEMESVVSKSIDSIKTILE
ncbi:adenosylmethionine--8-amino-7-oxononanoate transaminase [Clostridium cylindrosporum]|uniref:Adenosylmethionine-8-amino-7-oxononanoate aminotransferase n=1 Tax=Clostridium cylindrosporum DSM 605 TaxID=1121307 RepID=A0A0J8D9J8_CLOCY|nr:adenosylmethionine--8-amino-7-oxononanoate transaminase [Clostridium cylindrosporum]KMT20978.1 adenosylmethionine-8-amino-7-oxononanoate aminotransferase BioA [Clostridium cylindrosporum DSM 605]